jgi:hypothetical protein
VVIVHIQSLRNVEHVQSIQLSLTGNLTYLGGVRHFPVVIYESYGNDPVRDVVI